MPPIRTPGQLRAKPSERRGKILFCLPGPSRKTLLVSLIHELSTLGWSTGIADYLGHQEPFWGKPRLRFWEDSYASWTWDVVVVLDIGYLDGAEIVANFPRAFRVMWAGDSPQSLGSSSYLSVAKSLVRNSISNSTNPFVRRIGLMNSAGFYHLVVASDPGAVRMFQEQGHVAYWMPYWARSFGERRQEGLVGQQFNTEDQFDCVSVMTPRSERKSLLRALEQSNDVKFKNFLNVPDDQVISRYSYGLTGLNVSSFQEVTIRFFEVAAAGRVSFTNHLSPNSGLEQLFEPDRHFFLYSGKSHLIWLIRQLASDPRAALELGKDARERVRAAHMANHRAMYFSALLEGDDSQ